LNLSVWSGVDTLPALVCGKRLRRRCTISGTAPLQTSSVTAPRRGRAIFGQQSDRACSVRENTHGDVSKSQWRTVALMVAVCVALRVGMLFAIHAHHTDAGMYEHEVIASSLASGNGFRYAFFSDRPLLTSQQAPAIPYLLSFCFRIAGGNTPAARLLYLLGVNVVLAAGATLAMWQLGRRTWNPTVGAWAAAGFAIYPPLIYATTRIQAATWSVCWLLVALTLTMEACHRRNWKWGCLAGASAGMGLLGEPIIVLPAALVFLALAMNCLREPRRLSVVAAALLAAAVVLAPWMVRNTLVHQRIVFIKSTFWYCFWQGNHQGASGTDKLLPDDELRSRLAWAWGGANLEADLNAAREQAVSVDSHLSQESLAAIVAAPSEIEKVDHFQTLAGRDLSEDPGHYLRMCGLRLGQMLWFDPTNPRAYVLSYRLSYLVLLGLAVIGVGLSMTGRRAVYWQLPLLAGLGILVFHALTITSARFRLPIEALLLLPAAVVFAALGDIVCRFCSRFTRRAVAESPVGASRT
jgi:4-amino-4-deoxy-L-arabinose transferase-like glycosyltransferase